MEGTLVVTCLNGKISSVNCKLYLFDFVTEQGGYAGFIHKNHFSSESKKK